MIRNINDRGTRGSGSGRQNGWRWLTGGALLGVALSAFVFLGWLPGMAALFSGFNPSLPELKLVLDDPKNDLRADATKYADPVAAVLSHWEYTGHCTSAAVTGCPSTCGSAGGSCAGALLTSCCTSNDNGHGPSFVLCTCGTDTGGRCCDGCCTGNGTFVPPY